MASHQFDGDGRGRGRGHPDDRVSRDHPRRQILHGNVDGIVPGRDNRVNAARLPQRDDQLARVLSWDASLRAFVCRARPRAGIRRPLSRLRPSPAPAVCPAPYSKSARSRLRRSSILTPISTHISARRQSRSAAQGALAPLGGRDRARGPWRDRCWAAMRTFAGRGIDRRHRLRLALPAPADAIFVDRRLHGHRHLHRIGCGGPCRPPRGTLSPAPVREKGPARRLLGGYRQSGWGREMGYEAIELYTRDEGRGGAAVNAAVGTSGAGAAPLAPSTSVSRVRPMSARRPRTSRAARLGDPRAAAAGRSALPRPAAS